MANRHTIFCCATTTKGTRCKKHKVDGNYCIFHSPSLQCVAICKNGSKCQRLKIGNFDFCRAHTSRETCSICLSDIHNVFSLNCRHNFCVDCIAPWLDNKLSCPCCRASVDKMDRMIAYEMSTLFQLVVLKQYSFTGINMEKAEEIMIKCGLYSHESPSSSFKDFVLCSRMKKILENEELRRFFEKLPCTESNVYINAPGPVHKFAYQMVFPY